MALVYIASDAFRVYKRLTGAVLDNKTGLLQVTPTQYAALKTMTFNIGGVRLPPQYSMLLSH